MAPAVAFAARYAGDYTPHPHNQRVCRQRLQAGRHRNLHLRVFSERRVRSQSYGQRGIHAGLVDAEVCSRYEPLAPDYRKYYADWVTPLELSRVITPQHTTWMRAAPLPRQDDAGCRIGERPLPSGAIVYSGPPAGRKRILVPSGDHVG